MRVNQLYPFNVDEFGFKYRLEDEILKRNELLQLFHKLCKKYHSNLIELPIVAPASWFLGERPRPLSSKHGSRLFTDLDPEGNSLAVRYEGTALVAQKMSSDLMGGEAIHFRHHYFQEMVRMEFKEDLDSRHLRGFYQAGFELFGLSEEEHQRNIIALISFMGEFLSLIGKKPVIRVSHIDIIQEPLEVSGVEKHDIKRIKTYMENYNLNELVEFMINIKIDKDAGNAILNLASLGVSTLDKCFPILERHAKYYSKAMEQITCIYESLPHDILALTRFDAGICRSLDFYSGVTFQCDVDGMKECGGGGDFSGLVETYGTSNKVYSVGMAAGVERLMQSMAQKI